MHNIYYVGKQRGCRHIHKCTSSCNAINILMCFSDLHSTAAILSSFLFSTNQCSIPLWFEKYGASHILPTI